MKWLEELKELEKKATQGEWDNWGDKDRLITDGRQVLFTVNGPPEALTFLPDAHFVVALRNKFSDILALLDAYEKVAKAAQEMREWIRETTQKDREAGYSPRAQIKNWVDALAELEQAREAT